MVQIFCWWRLWQQLPDLPQVFGAEVPVYVDASKMGEGHLELFLRWP